MSTLAFIVSLLAVASAQKIGTMTVEEHLKMPIQSCTTASGCVNEEASIALDSNWRWLHKSGCEPNCRAPDNCYTGNTWNTTVCKDANTCTSSCALDGVDEKTYASTYGVRADGKGMLNMSFVTKGQYSRNVGSRLYLLKDDDHYKMFNLLNKEFTFTVDTSMLPCGLNGALYLVEMEEDGGKASYSTNEAGARFGTGYCDAQCPHDLKWINGEANVEGWVPSKTDENAGVGKYGTCCAELDIWEANRVSTQMTVHGCTTKGQHRCEGIECGDNAGGHRFDGVCDKNGCDFNPYRVGDHQFYGNDSSFKLDSSKPMTVTTQFITSDGTDTGELVKMVRIYKQGDTVITNAVPTYGSQYTAISDDMCAAQMTNFSDRLDVFKAKGSVKGMGEAMARSMVLTLSMWDDHDVGMIWLDAADPYPINQSSPWGARRGTCPQDSGNYSVVEKEHPGAYVIYSDIRYGEIGSTTGHAPSPAPSPAPPAPGPTGCANKLWGQCGGKDAQGLPWDKEHGHDQCCPQGSGCKCSNPYYSQCVPAPQEVIVL